MSTIDISAGPDRIGRTEHHRISPLTALRHGLTLAGRNLVKIKHNGEELIDLSLQPILFISLFVYLFGGAIAGDQHTYMQFVLPGLMVQTVLFATMRTGFGLNSDINTGLFDRFRSMPIARSAPLVGAVLADVFRYVVSIVVIIAFGSALGFRIETNPAGAAAACLLTIAFALGLAWGSALIGLLVKKPESVQGYAFLLLFPLTFGSNMFVATDTMPGWLQAWVDVNPISQLVTACRGLMVGGDEALTMPIVWTLVWAVGLTLVFFPLTLVAYRRRL